MFYSYKRKPCDQIQFHYCVMSGSENSNAGDPDTNRLIVRIVDKLDEVLFAHGFEFREEEDWENMILKLGEFIYKYWDDVSGGDSDYDPAHPPDTSSSVTVSLHGSEEQDEEEEELDEEDDEPAVSKKKSKSA